jgi:hypothetical protein
VVYIQVKPYNSYLVDKIWVGSVDGSRSEDPVYLRKYLFDHGLDDLGFQYVLRGKFPSRPFISMPGQTFKGKVRSVRDREDKAADR